MKPFTDVAREIAIDFLGDFSGIWDGLGMKQISPICVLWTQIAENKLLIK